MRGCESLNIMGQGRPWEVVGHSRWPWSWVMESGGSWEVLNFDPLDRELQVRWGIRGPQDHQDPRSVLDHSNAPFDCHRNGLHFIYIFAVFVNVCYRVKFCWLTHAYKCYDTTLCYWRLCFVCILSIMYCSGVILLMFQCMSMFHCVMNYIHSL